jgi:hypothetical protein
MCNHRAISSKKVLFVRARIIDADADADDTLMEGISAPIVTWSISDRNVRVVATKTTIFCP